MKKNKKQGRCIFCNGYGMSKQHVIPEWIKRFLTPTNEKEHTHFQNTVEFDEHDLDLKPGKVTISPKLKLKQGPIGSSKIYKVCLKCNSGWMSELEQTVKPLLSSLMLGQPKVISKDESTLLAQWVMMTSFVQEFTDERGQFLSQSEREAFMNRRAIPVNFKIYIGYTSDKTWFFRRKNEISSFFLKFSNPFNLPESHPLVMQKHFMQTFSFGLGELFIICYNTSYSDMIFDIQELYPNSLSKIFESEQGNATEIVNIEAGKAEEISGCLTRLATKVKAR